MFRKLIEWIGILLGITMPLVCTYIIYKKSTQKIDETVENVIINLKEEFIEAINGPEFPKYLQGIGANLGRGLSAGAQSGIKGGIQKMMPKIKIEDAIGYGIMQVIQGGLGNLMPGAEKNNSPQGSNTPKTKNKFG